MHYYVPTLSVTLLQKYREQKVEGDVAAGEVAEATIKRVLGLEGDEVDLCPSILPLIYTILPLCSATISPLCPSILRHPLPLHCPSLYILQHAPSLLCLSTACTHTPYTSLYATSPRTLPRVPHPLTNLTRLPPYTHAPPRIGGVAQEPHAHLQEDLCHASAVPPDRVSSM